MEVSHTVSPQKREGLQRKSKKPRITEKVFLGSGQHPMGEAGRDKEALSLSESGFGRADLRELLALGDNYSSYLLKKAQGLSSFLEAGH